MEKKYKLKEEVKKYFNCPNDEAINTIEYWNSVHVNRSALEEVPSRIELVKESYGMGMGDRNHYLGKKINNPFTDQEKDLCEKALNGELLDIDSLNDEDFESFYKELGAPSFLVEGIKEVLKEYLKQKK